MRTILLRNKLDENLLMKWNDLWNKSEEGHFFNTPEWLLAYCRSHGVKNFSIVTIEDDDELLLVLPLVKERFFGISAYGSPGGKYLNKSSLLIKNIDKELLQELINYLIKQGNFCLKELSAELADIIEKIDNRLIKKESSINPYINLDDPYKFLSNKQRNKIRNTIARNKNALRYESFTGDMNALNLVFEMDKRSSRTKKGKATFVDDTDRKFCQDMLKSLPKNFQIDLLYYEKDLICYSIELAFKKVIQAFNTGYNENYRQLRPGKILTYLLLDRLKNENYEILDFSRGNSILKQEFTSLLKKNYEILFSKNLFVMLWWEAAERLSTAMQENKFLYKQYLFFKKVFLYK
jgi:CelD/BcsL family acetyltransferase involved in cellulose biosynthesis